MRVHIASQRRPNLDTLAGWRDRLREAAEAARALAARAATADEMEAIAADLDPAGLFNHARSGEVGRPSRPSLVEPPAREPVPHPRAGAPVDGNLVDLREALAREQREIQRALDAGFGTIEQLHARERGLALLDNTVGEERLADRQSPCGNDVLLFPYRGPRRPRLAAPRGAGSPDDGDAA
jgi:hypothetical protein